MRLRRESIVAAPTTGGKKGLCGPEDPYPARFRRDPVGILSERRIRHQCQRWVCPMSLLSSIDPLYVLSGFAVGFLVGQTGMGGGALMTLILVLLFGVHPTTAVGTDLLFAAATKTRLCGP